jgi:hypothetical protein
MYYLIIILPYPLMLLLKLFKMYRVFILFVIFREIINMRGDFAYLGISWLMRFLVLTIYICVYIIIS